MPPAEHCHPALDHHDFNGIGGGGDSHWLGGNNDGTGREYHNQRSQKYRFEATYFQK